MVGVADLDRSPVDAAPYVLAVRAVLDRGVLTTTAGSYVRLAGLASQGVVTRPLVDFPPSVASVAVRRPSEQAEAFVRTAVDVTAQLLALVPEARLPEPSAAR